MKDLHMPASYATIPEDEQRLVIGGGELKDAWNNFVEDLHLDDFFFGGGIISISVSFVPMLLFRVAGACYNFAENAYNNITNWLGIRDDTLDALQSYTDEMRQKQQQDRSI